MEQGHPMGGDRLRIRMSDGHENIHETAKKTQRVVHPVIDRTEVVGTTIVTAVLRGHITAHSRSFR
jgi:hypothetical protein